MATTAGTGDHAGAQAKRARAADGFALFDTAVGACAIAWSARGIAGSQLPERSAAATRARMRRRFPGAPEAEPPAAVRPAVDAITALLRGEPADLSTLPLDWAGVSDFDRRVYEVARTVPPGGTIAYGEIARRMGEPGAARGVGQALGRNPFAPIVPCHRVLAAGGRPGGFSASGGTLTKFRLLAIEGAALPLG